jgi:hypothetical protein
MARSDLGSSPQPEHFLKKRSARPRDAVWPRLLLSRVILEEGRDMAAAEEALRAVLALDPNQREARSKLEAAIQT